MSEPTIIEVQKEFSEALSEFGQIVLAGGAVRDHLMNKPAKDFDVFCLYRGEWDFKEAKERMGSKIESIYGTKKTAVEWHKSEPYLVANTSWRGAEVQVMANPARHIRQLIGTFDWSVCLYGWDGYSFYQDEPIENIVVGGELRLQKATFPLSTLRRGFRFSERFLMKLRPEDISLLCGMVLERVANKDHKGPGGNEPDMPALEANVLV